MSAQKLVLIILSLSLASLLLGCQSSGPTEISCGGGASFICPPSYYCEQGNDCGGIDHKGLCRRIPADCPMEEDSVCGCNHKTFPNACYANGSGITVAYKGPCIAEH